uniref:ATP-dependent DNA helicase n=1 Tax=Setaria italica TaxID=4555 RepID=K3ZDX1_SETIT
FSETIEQGKDTCPIYRRREDGQKVKVGGEELDNRWVVPYNPVLLMRYNFHINVEICNSIKSVKYLYKYVYKGHDQTSFSVDEKGNERRVINPIKQYCDARMITTIEVMQLHLPGFHMVAYNATDNLQGVVDLAKSQRSMLTEYFKMNERSAKARKYLYKEFPEYFTWNKSGKCWKPRVPRKDYRLVDWAAAKVMGFVDTDKSLDDCLTECAMIRFPSSLRRLFATIMFFCECANIHHLWDKHYESLAEDFCHTNDNNTIVEHYGLPELHESGKIVIEICYEEEHLEIIDTLNAEQRAGFEEIFDHVMKGKGQVFFMDGPGGTGKTYLYKTLLAKVHSMDLIVVATATSGIAASIMPGGRTAHSRFKIPIKLDDSTMCSFTKQSGTTELLRRASLMIWDEVVMTKRQCVEALDRSLQDIMDCTQPFDGKVMLFGGDFRQVLPVVACGTRAQITAATLLKSYIWENV